MRGARLFSSSKQFFGSHLFSMQAENIGRLSGKSFVGRTFRRMDLNTAALMALPSTFSTQSELCSPGVRKLNEEEGIATVQTLEEILLQARFNLNEAVANVCGGCVSTRTEMSANKEGTQSN